MTKTRNPKHEMRNKIEISMSEDPKPLGRRGRVLAMRLKAGGILRAGWLVGIMVGGMLVATVLAAEEKPVRAGNLQAVSAWTQAQQQQHAGQSNVWIASGVVADRTARTVTVVAEATGLAEAGIVEFLSVGAKSEKDYESLTVALASAGDICRGLEFLGLPRGRPVQPARCQFWPKGERVRVTIRQLGRDAKSSQPLAACMRDKREKPVATENFVYVGSSWIGDVCQADQVSPGAWISTYNEPAVVLDVPYHAPQGEVYGSLVVTEAGRFERGALLLLTLTPDCLSNGVPRVVDFSLTVQAGAEGTNATLATLRGITQGTERGLEALTNDLKGSFERLAGLAKEGRDPFVTLTLEESLTAGIVRELARVLNMVEGSGGVRIEAPPAGQPYYKAFLPDERWRKRLDRPSQPWEVRVGRTPQGGWRCTLVQIMEDWSKEGQLTPDLTPTEFPLDRPEEFLPKIEALIAAQTAEVKQKLTKSGKSKQLDYMEPLLTLKRINTLFVFTPPDAPLGAFLPVVRALQERLPQVYIFVE
jgi:hypothetical protein